MNTKGGQFSTVVDRRLYQESGAFSRGRLPRFPNRRVKQALITPYQPTNNGQTYLPLIRPVILLGWRADSSGQERELGGLFNHFLSRRS
jgi:hypothetical protein